MEGDKLCGKVVALSLKLTTFFSKGKQMKLNRYIWTYEDIYKNCV